MRRTTPMLAAALAVMATSSTACSSGSKSTSANAPTSPTVATSDNTNATASTSKAAAAGGQPNVCSLLTAAQASSIVGVTFTAATPTFGGKTCTYVGGSVPMNVTLTANSGGTAAWTDELAGLKEGGGATPVALSGLGDRAAETTGSLATQSGNSIIQVDAADESSVNGGNIGGDFTKSIAVARALIAAQH
jgi:hypothetical protein